MSNSATLWTAAHQASLSSIISQGLLKLMSIESMMPSNHLISAALFFCLQSFPASGSFTVSQLFALSGQSIGASAKVFPMNIQSWLTELFSGSNGLIFLQSKGFSTVFSSTAVQKHRFFSFVNFFDGPPLTSIHDYWKNHVFEYMDHSQQSMPLLFNILSRFVSCFLPRTSYLLISWPQSPSTVILEPKKSKSITASIFSPSICYEMMGWDIVILIFFFLPALLRYNWHRALCKFQVTA